MISNAPGGSLSELMEDCHNWLYEAIDETVPWHTLHPQSSLMVYSRAEEDEMENEMARKEVETCSQQRDKNVL